MNAVTETYTDVEKLVYKTCWNFQKRYGGDFDDYVSRAHEIFMDVFHGHDDSMSPFHCWLRYKISMGLMDDLRRRVYRDKTLKRNPDVNLGNIPQKAPGSRLTNDSVSKDIHTILELIADSGPELQALLRLGDKRDGLWDYLRGLGWTADRIRESFDEIVSILGR